jgi:hypothetical protein
VPPAGRRFCSNEADRPLEVTKRSTHHVTVGQDSPKEVRVDKALVTFVLAFSMALATGCYSTAPVSKEELTAIAGNADIVVSMRDSLEYRFSVGNYHVHGDTLSGYGIQTRYFFPDVALDAALPFGGISSIETREFNLVRGITLVGGIGLGALILMFLAGRH